MKVVKFEEIELHIDESNTLSTKEVAQGYGISPSVVRTHKSLHNDELIENVHYILKRDDRNRLVTRWTLEGVHMLGFFIKSERAKEFRKFTAKLLTEIKKGNIQVSVAHPKNCPAEQFDSRIAGYKGIIARLKNQNEELRAKYLGAQAEIIELKHALEVQQSHDSTKERLINHIAGEILAAFDQLNKEIKKAQERIDNAIANLLAEPKEIGNHIVFKNISIPKGE